MKKLSLVLFLAAISCSDRSDNRTEPQDPVTVAVEEKNEGGGYLSKRAPVDLLVEIYNEQVKNSPVLKKLEDEIDLAVDHYDSTKTFREYDKVNRQYFSSAQAHKERIDDSLLKKRIEIIIKAYSDKYASMIGKHNTLVSDLDSNNNTISDLHLALKIVQTLPEMHRHQQKNLPSTKPMEQAVQKQRNVINKLDGAVKKNGG